jgi:putative membrane-bound dehydrogenase-like protein
MQPFVCLAARAGATALHRSSCVTATAADHCGAHDGRSRSLRVLHLLTALLILLAAYDASAETLVGLSRVDVTPSYPVRLSGFGFRREESEGVRQRIFVKAMAIGADDSPGGPALILAADNLGIPDVMTRELARRLEPLGVRADRLVVTATHTHTAPMLNDVAPTLFGRPLPEQHRKHVDRYSREFADHLVEAAKAALAARRPAKLRWSSGRCGFAVNRRTEGGPVDHDLPVLAIFDTSDRVIGIWTTYACHCVTLSENRIGGDWAGYAQEHLERIYPGSVALVSIGCGADANPRSGVTGDKAEVADAQGLEVAREVQRLLEQPMIELTAPITTRLQRIELPLAELPAREEWERRLADADDAIRYHAAIQMERLNGGVPLTSSIPYPVQTWTFGDQLAMVFLPGEVVVDYSLRLKQELDAKRLWIHAYANHCPGYVPSDRILREGGYEGGGAMVYYDYPGPYAMGTEQRIVEAVTGQLPASYRPTPPQPDLQSQASRTTAAADVPAVPLEPEAALAAMRTHEGLRVELVAAEPLVTSPVAISFAADGRLYVAEMYDYPSGVDGNFARGGRVKVLRDTNGDGRMDEAQVFLEDIPFPTGVTVWRDGVLVCAAPDILFARDTNGDGRADETRRILHGFGTDNFQARVNSLEYGLDGWVYGSCGLFGGTIESLEGRSVALGDRDFRFHPDTGELEPATGRTQQGRVRNDAGDWFGCDNSNLVYHYPLDDHVLRRNPAVIARETLVHLAGGEAGATLFPISRQVLFKLSGPPGRVTAACGLGIYRDQYLGAEYFGNAFTCEPVNNVVHRQVLTPEGVTYRGERSANEQDREFLASSDPWFRPVQARTGPEGALWIVDMYRYVIEHPRWIPPESLEQLDVRAGADRGRIYRIVRRDAPPRRPVSLQGLSAPELVDAIDSPNGPQRDLALQSLVWQQASASRDVPASGIPASLATQLEGLLQRAGSEWTRLSALVALDQLRALRVTHLQTALQDRSPAVRRHAVRLASNDPPSHLPPDTSPALTAELRRAVLDLIDSNDANYTDQAVRMQVAISLAGYPVQETANALASLLRQAETPIQQAAVLSSLHADNLPAVVSASLSVPRVLPAHFLDNLRELAVQAAFHRSDTSLSAIADWMERREDLADVDRWRIGAACFEGRARAGATDQPLPAPLLQALAASLTSARQTLAQPAAPLETRRAAVRLLGVSELEQEANRRELLLCLGGQYGADLVTECIAALESQSSAEICEQILRALPEASPRTAELLVSALLQRTAWTARLLDQLEENAQPAPLPRSLLGAADIGRLRQHEDETIRRRAEQRFADRPISSLDQLDKYLQALQSPGEASRGREVFVRHCAGCHRWKDQGQAVGPDLASYQQKPAEAIVIAVLDPNQAIDPRYVNYNATTVDGRTFSGIIQQETATALTLADGKREPVTLARPQIDYLQRTGLSLMPSGLAAEITPAAMADLIAYLQQP